MKETIHQLLSQGVRHRANLLLGFGLFAASPEVGHAQTITHGRPVRPQTVVPLGAGRYASEPPYHTDVHVDAQNGIPAHSIPDTTRYDFYHRSPLYITHGQAEPYAGAHQRLVDRPPIL